MAQAVTALDDAHFEGRVAIRDAGLQGMISLRVDTNDRTVYDALHVVGFTMPKQGRVAGGIFEGGALWMSPDEALLLCPYDEVEAVLARLKKQMSGVHYLACDVSDARVVLTLKGEGPHLREVLAKLTPADMRSDTFAVGQIRRTRLAQVPAAIWFEAEDRAFVVGFRSDADYIFGILENAAKPGGEVGYF